MEGLLPVVMDVKALGQVAGGVEAARRGAVAAGLSDARSAGRGPRRLFPPDAAVAPLAGGAGP